MVPRSSDRISRVPPYLICLLKLRIRGCHPYRWPFQTILLTFRRSAGPRSLATTNGVSIDFLSSGYLDVSVPRVRSKTPMYSGLKYLVMPIDVSSPRHRRLRPRVGAERRCEATTMNNQVGSPIRTSMDQSLFPAPHGLTQGITSFIASCCQGIHQTPFSRLI